VIRPLIRRRAETFGYKTLSQRARWLDDVASARGGRLYARMTSHFRFSPERKAELYGEALAQELRGADALSALSEPFDGVSAATSLDRMLHTDLVTRLPEHTLMLADRLAMAKSLEVRSPLLDVRLAEVCLAMPARLRVRGGRTKVGLRLAVADWIPRSLLARGKQGFMFPVADWLDVPTLRDITAYMLDGPLVREQWIRADAVTRLASEHASRQADHHVRIWQLMSLDSWHRQFVGDESHGQQTERLAQRLGGVPDDGVTTTTEGT
jgi:asparagine synthase (glutamine-hydrolysing)